MPQPFNREPLDEQQWVAYLDLSGGRNTKKDPHAIDRNQLVVSDNTWIAQGNTIAKRPGNVSLGNISSGVFAGGLVSAGGVGFGISLKGMVEGRFFNQTALVVQTVNNQVGAVPIALPTISTNANSWVSIGSISGGTIAAAQLFDPDPKNKNGPDGTLFIVTGQDVPLSWGGPGNPLVPLTYLEPALLPQKADGSGKPITPAYVATLFSSLFYAGEPTDPSMVYVSDPWRPESFTSNLVVPTGTITGASYIGAPIGRGDGVNGGSITGLQALGSAMVVYKQSAIYMMTQVGILGDMVWGSSVASASVGMVSPRSLVAFDTFHVFLGIDGVYAFDGTTTTKLSKNNPDLFDGPTAICLNRNSAIAVRFGNRYLIFFDDGGNTGAALGYCNRGAWFDFDKPDNDGLPSVGTMSGMNVGGVAPLRGPNDTGNFAWADATQDRVGTFSGTTFGSIAYSDFNRPITVTVTGKADWFVDDWGVEAVEELKVVDSVHLLMSFSIINFSQSYTFSGTTYYDQANSLLSSGTSAAFPTFGLAIVGSAIVGIATVGVASGTPIYQHIPLWQQDPSIGSIIQFSFTESSSFPWTCLGYAMLVNRQRRVGVQSG